MTLLAKFPTLTTTSVEPLSHISSKLKSERKTLESRDHADTSISLTSIGSAHFKMGNEIEGIKLAVWMDGWMRTCLNLVVIKYPDACFTVS